MLKVTKYLILPQKSFKKYFASFGLLLIKTQVFILLFSVTLLSFNLREVNANTALAISPSSGTFSESIFVDVLVGTIDSPITTLEINITPTGPIGLASSSPGNLGCTPVVTVNSTGVINVKCTATTGSLSNSGNLVNLTFGTSTDGPASLAINVINTDGTVDSIEGATYTISGSPGTYTGYSNYGGGGLPNTGIFDNQFVQYGILVVIGGLIVLGISSKRYLVFEEKKKYDNTPMSEKLD